MARDLLALLRSRNCIGQLHNLEGLEAADRIEDLEAEIKRLQARERELEAALAAVHLCDCNPVARTALAAVSAETEEA